MKLCPLCFKYFNNCGFEKHLEYCQIKKEYYKKPIKCLNPNCENILTYDQYHKRKQKFCCIKCTFTEERLKEVGDRSRELLKNNPEIFKTFGKINGINIKYKSKNGTVNLQSTYEEKVATELDKHNIDWIRPSYLKYIDKNGKQRKYFPDFYLKKYNVYLDPKNDYLIKQHFDKIRRAGLYNNVKILILTVNQLTWKEIKLLI